MVEYTVPVPSNSPLAQRTLLFLADVHWPTPIPDLAQLCTEIWQGIQPDWVVFGGDLSTYSCHLPDAFQFLQSLPPPAISPAIAVCGNWDRRRRWFSHRYYQDAFSRSGFHLLVNESCTLGGITFHGLDEPNIGRPEMARLTQFNPFDASFHCLVSHNIEPVVRSFPTSFPFQLCLCGHTHAGQIRIPAFGALLTSSRYWKLFEYGLYRHQHCDSNLIVTSGIGCSRIPFRLFCQPEVVIVRFQDANRDVESSIRHIVRPV